MYDNTGNFLVSYLTSTLWALSSVKHPCHFSNFCPTCIFGSHNIMFILHIKVKMFLLRLVWAHWLLRSLYCTHGVACNYPCFASFVGFLLIQMAFFTCRVVLFIDMSGSTKVITSREVSSLEFAK